MIHLTDSQVVHLMSHLIQADSCRFKPYPGYTIFCAIQHWSNMVQVVLLINVSKI